MIISVSHEHSLARIDQLVRLPRKEEVNMNFSFIDSKKFPVISAYLSIIAESVEFVKAGWTIEDIMIKRNLNRLSNSLNK